MLWYFRYMAMHSVTLVFLLSSVCLAEWQFVGPFGGSADVVRVARSNPQVVVAAARNGLIYGSVNAGASWNRVAFPGEHGSVLHALEIDPADAGRWYTGVEDDLGRGAGVYRTSDSGLTWSRLPGMAGKAIWSLAIWQKDSNVVVAGAADGIYRSSDRGETWTRISPEVNKALQPVVALALDPVDPQVLYAGTTHLPWRTMDGGRTWTSVHTGMLDDSDVFSIVIHPQRRGIVYASACSGAYRSADSASLWSRLPTPRGTFRTYVVAIDPRSPTTVYAGTSAGLLQSLDEGKIWKKIHGHVVKSIDFDRDNGRIYFASTTSGILASLDSGRTVIESNLGFVNRTWSAFAAVKGVLFTSSLYDAGGGLFRSQDAGATWSRPSQSEVTRGEGLQFIAPSPTSVFGATRSTLWRSNDSGKSWAPLANQPSAGPILALSFSGAGGLYLATPSGLHQSRDEGSTWKRVVLPINGTLRSVQISNDALFAVAGSTTAMSRDAGGSWTTCAAPPASVDWYGVAIKPDSPVVLAATSHGLLRSADDCNTWSFVRNGMEASTVMNVVVHPSRPQIFAVQRGRLLTSSDDGQTWRSISKVKGSESTPTILGIFPESADQIFALFPRQGIAQWKLHAVDPTTQ